MRAAAQRLDQLSGLLDRIALWIALLSVASLVLIAGWQAAARYLLDQPPAWTEEVARYMMVWAGLMGASCAFRAHADPTLFPAARARTGRIGAGFALLRSLGTILFVIPVLWYCAVGLNGRIASGYIARNARQMAETVDVPMSAFALAIPVGFGLILVHALAHLATAFASSR